MADRSATDKELRTLAERGTMAPNSTFDGVRYRVTPESRDTSTSSPKSDSNSTGSDTASGKGMPATASAETEAEAAAKKADAQAGAKTNKTAK